MIINGYTLEFDEESHTYLVDGVIVPSVTQILKVRFGHKYDGINKEVLNRAAQRGTAIHKAIEEYCKGKWDNLDVKEVRNFKFLMVKYAFDVELTEVPIIIFKKDKPIAAGRLDLILNDGANQKAVADIKTTATLDREYLAYQLNLYRIGYMQCYRQDIKRLYGVHLKDDKRKMVMFPVNQEKAWEIIREYEEGL